MLDIAEYAARLLTHVAIAADKLSLGVLMDPAEVARTVTPHQHQAASGRWWLCGNLHPQMFAAAAKQPLNHLGKVIVTGQGTRYLVLAQQVGAWQHRLLLQVAGRQVRDFLACSLSAGFELSLGLTGGSESLLVQDCRFVAPLLGRVDLRAEGTPQMPPHRLRREACTVASALLCPREVTVPQLPAPEHVCVSIVASCELVQAVMDEEDRSR